MLGMRPSELTPGIMDEILNLYGRVCRVPEDRIFWRRNQNGWTGAYHVRRVIEGLRHYGATEWRYGSGLPGIPNVHAKLLVRKEHRLCEEGEEGVEEIIRFSFDPNDSSAEEGDEAKKMKDNFRLAVEEFLVQRGLAVPLPDRQ